MRPQHCGCWDYGVPSSHAHRPCALASLLLPTGQCFDAHTDHPIPGLEYSLGTPTQPDLFDTIVMANLGYFQLKAGPGVWSLRLREGRSHDLYTVTR